MAEHVGPNPPPRVGRQLHAASGVESVHGLDEPGAPLELLDGLRGAPNLTRLAIGPLGTEAVATIVRRYWADADAAVCDACHRATGGNPLLVYELVRATGPSNGRPTPEDVLAVAVPSLGDRVLRRAARVA